jgi:serine/threonine-protein kinase
MSDESHEPMTDDLGGAPLDAGLRAAFGLDSDLGSWGGESILALLERDHGVRSHVRLREGPDEDEATTTPTPDADGAHRGLGLGRFLVAGEIGRGGIGVVLKGRDTDLGREVAIKTLREEYAARPEMVRRLLEEAQIGGQLQHPGVLPVYEMGLDPGRRPYFAMKLVRGRTLAALLADRADPAADRRRFVAVFEQVCQTVAYAHARGVIHRDLKPSNVMVGGFGEVQVVDWGLAKVLGRDAPSDEPVEGALEPLSDEGTVATPGRGISGPRSGSEAGSVLGTPAYMAPEQARGEVENLDERCDVFALGALLCEILTGRPPYSGAPAEALRQASAGQTDDALARLDACGADAELVRLARNCLAADPSQRPRDAGALAQEVSAYLASADERVRQAELDSARARVRAESERKARQWTAAAGASALLAVLVAGGAYLLAVRREADIERQRVARLQQSMATLGLLNVKGVRLLDLAGASSEADAPRWAEVLAVAAESLRQTLSPDADEPTRRRTYRLLEQFRREEAALRARAATRAPGP